MSRVSAVWCGACGSVCPGGSSGCPVSRGVGRSVGVGTVERACRADVGRAFAGMEQNGFCGE